MKGYFQQILVGCSGKAITRHALTYLPGLRLFPNLINAAVAETAFLAFYQRLADDGDFFRGFLFAELPFSDKLAYLFALITEVPGFDLCLHPGILVVGH